LGRALKDLLELVGATSHTAGHRVHALGGGLRSWFSNIWRTSSLRCGLKTAAFNNAGINCDGAPLLETDDDEFDNILDVNLRGVWNCMKAELRQMTA
jgi:NAD(P)-dependent dehydrogenase (short-subunit alcohol dehydrogenase family)